MPPFLKNLFGFSFLKVKKFPSLPQWLQIFKILNKKEKIAFIVFFALFISSAFFLLGTAYFNLTKPEPGFGGSYTEGVVGAPRLINPIYATASDTDRDLVELLFAGLMRYEGSGKIVPDAVQNYEIKEEGRVYEFYLKENITWQDGVPLSADDVIFTIQTIQNPNYKSPLRLNWVGIEIEKIGEKGIRFILKNPYSAFLETTTVKILPSHIWKDINAENFPLSIYNVKPVGSGPYKLKELQKDENGFIKSLILVRNPDYFGKKPYLNEIKFLFFDNEEELVKAAQKSDIQGFSSANIQTSQKIKNKMSIYAFSLPRYFAVFFNPQNSKVLSDLKIRQAINYGTDKNEILNKFLNSKGHAVDSPILPQIYGFDPPSFSYEFNAEKAKKILDDAGFVETAEGVREKKLKREASEQIKNDLKLGSQGEEVKILQRCLAKDPEVYPEGEITGYFGNSTKKAVILFQEKYRKEILDPWGFKEGTGLVSKTTRTKLNELCAGQKEETMRLRFSLITVDQPLLVQIAEELKNQWKALGIDVQVRVFAVSELERDIIKPRNYDALLFGEVLGAVPDPFPFWHSLQKKDPGLNLAYYENKEADNLLEEARQTLDEEERKEKYQQLQEIIIKDAPAVFLYSPDFLYAVSGKIKGIDTKIIVDPSKRFSDITNWYLKTQRVW